MKKILVLLLFVCAHTTFAQEKQEVSKKRKRPIDTSLRYDPHSLGISYKMGVVMNSQGGYAVHGAAFEIYTQERKGKTKYTPMVGIRISSPFSGINSYTYGGLRWGFLFGGSQYVFDIRSKETGKGWSMLVNGGLTADIPSVKEFIEIANYPITLGVELDFKAIYNVHKYVGVSFGLHMGYAFGFSAQSVIDGMISGTPSVGGVENPVEYDHSFIVGLNFGLIF